jgi:hypothetical protein
MAEVKRCPFRKYHPFPLTDLWPWPNQKEISFGHYGRAIEEIPVFGQCIEKECGFWNENRNLCSMIFLGSLEDIIIEIQLIRQKQ